MSLVDAIAIYLYSIAHDAPLKYVSYARLYSHIDEYYGVVSESEFIAALRYLVGRRYIEEEAAHYRLISDGVEYAYNVLNPPPNYEQESLEQQKKSDQNAALYFFITTLVSCIGILVTMILNTDKSLPKTPPGQIETVEQQPTINLDTSSPINPGPIDFVISYWKNVSDGKFETSWSQLSPSFRQSNHNNDYFDYLDGYQDMNICRIEVSNLDLIQQDNNSAVVTAYVVYYMGTQCNRSGYIFEIGLIYDEAMNSWLYDRTTIK